MAMMVVTVAVALLALSFSITSHDLREQGDGTELKEGATRLLNTMENDVSVWWEGMLVWTSMQARAATPYPLPDALKGYCLELIDIGDGSSSVTIEDITLPSDSPMVLKHACNVVRTDGSIGPGLIVLEVW
ncbi:MAG: hypothetical protein A4E32_01625 [Methanomassiliicoccales archaeon PtaU1.Bin124]|nr:MAG: hypothetical protein A4E32_01625 [Methanomassiliicoccales archaeon PtaU1.Bin124]